MPLAVWEPGPTPRDAHTVTSEFTHHVSRITSTPDASKLAEHSMRGVTPLPRFKRGDRVAIVDRETTAADRKSGLYYPHFRALHGAVDQVYEEQGEVCVEVDADSLPPDFLRRHQSIQRHIRQEWLDRLSDAERRALPEEHKDLRLKYTVMVAPGDLAPEPRGRAAKPAAPAAADAASSAAPSVSAGSSRPAAAPGRAAAKPQAGEATRRLTETELEAAEQAHLQELLRRARKE